MQIYTLFLKNNQNNFIIYIYELLLMYCIEYTDILLTDLLTNCHSDSVLAKIQYTLSDSI